MSIRFVLEPARKTQIEASYDLIVIGGGFAGVSAALAGARNSAKTLLIEKQYALGGLGTLGLIVDYLPLCDGNGTQMIGGIGEELLHASILFGPGEIPASWRSGKDPEAQKHHRYELTYAPAPMMIAMEQLLRDAGVEILYDCRFAGGIKNDGQIETVLCETKTGRMAFACKAVVDATGDADVCFSTGECTFERMDNVCAWWFYSYDGTTLRLNRKSDSFYAHSDSAIYYSGTDPRQITALCMESRRRTQTYLSGINSGCGSVYSNSTLSHDGSKTLCDDPERRDVPIYAAILPTIPGLRMTRRLVGRSELRESDEGIWFSDAVGMAGDWRKHGPRYCIPLSILCAQNAHNLLAAGRCVSAAGTAWDILRVIPVCAVTGEAAGTAAAMAALKHSGRIAALPIKRLQQQLVAQGVLLNRALFR